MKLHFLFFSLILSTLFAFIPGDNIQAEEFDAELILDALSDPEFIDFMQGPGRRGQRPDVSNPFMRADGCYICKGGSGKDTFKTEICLSGVNSKVTFPGNSTEFYRDPGTAMSSATFSGGRNVVVSLSANPKHPKGFNMTYTQNGQQRGPTYLCLPKP